MSRQNNLRKKYGRQLSDMVVKYVAATCGQSKELRQEIFKEFNSRWITITNEVNRKEKGTIELKREAFREMCDLNYKTIAKQFKPESKLKLFFRKLFNRA
jgi:hypothetical protein